MKRIEKRDYSKIVALPDDGFDRTALLRALFAPHKLIVMVGLPCVGKSFVLEEYENPDKHLTKWNRQPIFEMLFSNGERDEKYNSYIAQMESEMFPSLFQRDYHQILVDGYNRVRSARAHWVGLMPKRAGTVMACVLDGPKEKIVDRMMRDPRYAVLGSLDVSDWVDHMIDSTQWPSFEEGFDEIVYMNTFGDEGVKHLKSQVIQRTK